MIPIALRSYSQPEVFSYEADSICFVADLIAQQTGAVTLIDCGADIGLISARLIANCPAITRVIAFEPNHGIFPYLKRNIENLPIEGRAYESAVSDFAGKASLQYPTFDRSPHAAFIVPSATGDIDVKTIDTFGLTDIATLLLKIDVEGEELAVARGANQTLARAQDFVVVFEAHPKQTQRTENRSYGT